MTLKANEINPTPETLHNTIVEMRLESIRDRALIARLMRYAKDRQQDENMLAVYATIAKHNLGELYAPGGSLDPYIIPEGF